MEKKENTIKNILLVVFAIATIILGGFIIYDKALKKNNNISKVDQSTIGENFYQNMVKERKIMYEYDNGISIMVDKDGNAYYDGENVSNAVGTKGEYKIDGYISGIDYDGKGNNNIFSGYKLPISNVIAFYYSPVGNGGERDYIFIKADGTVAKLSYFLDIQKNVEIMKFEANVARYKNIIGMLPNNGFGGHGYRLFDINGNIYD